MKMKEFGPGGWGGQGFANDLGLAIFSPKLYQNGSLDTPMRATV